jgi:hypothetical protein
VDSILKRHRVRATTDRPSRRRTAALGMVATAAIVAPLTALPGSAHAAASATLPKDLAVFAHCPVGTKGVTACLYASMQGTFTIGSTTLSTTTPTTISLGLISTPKGITAVLPTDGSQALTSAAIPLPGGLLGIPGGPVIGPLEVSAQPELTGIPTVNIAALFSRKGTAVGLPLEVAVQNTLLGSGCTIGTAADPISLSLTDGTTNPPAPNTPVTGSLGTISSNAKGILKVKGATLVDNAFAAPGTSGCGPDGLLDGVINEDKGLPSAAGTNSATLTGLTETAPATLIKKYLG